MHSVGMGLAGPGGGAGAVELVGVLRRAHEQEVRQRESERRRQGGGMHRARGKDVASPGTDRGHEAGVEVVGGDELDEAGREEQACEGTGGPGVWFRETGIVWARQFPAKPP